MTPITDLLHRITGPLNDAKIDYMLSGGVATFFYTAPRTTTDIDIVIHLPASQVAQFNSLYSEEEYLYQKDAVRSAVLQVPHFFSLFDRKTGFKVDFIILQYNAFYYTAMDRRQVSTVFGFPVSVISLEDLVVAKLIWIQQSGSEHQKRDIRNLLTNPDINRNYIIGWCRELKLNTFGLIDI